MPLKQIVSYGTSDGQVFETEADALGHEEYLSNSKPIEVFIAESNVQRAHGTYLRRMLPKFIAFQRTFDPAAYPDPVPADDTADPVPAELAAEASEAAAAHDAGLPTDTAAAEAAAVQETPAKGRGRRTPQEYATGT